MNDAPLNVPTPSGVLVLFDPETLEHRRRAPREWTENRAELEREVAAAHVAALPLGEGQKAALVSIEQGAPPADPGIVTARVRVKHRGLFLGDRSELPSQAWGKRRWNAWDWLFAVFLVSIIPFGLWIVRFSADILWILFGTVALFIVLLIPLSLPFIRSGWGFARRSTMPPKDHPDRMLAFEPGEYLVALQRRGTDGVREHVSLWFGRSVSG
ncbi:MAG: hypothetical protein IRZ16_02035 [Myxococcaceae bacterium]|nr:hypothetical protein [Myxococcaceae bacterium]